MKKSLRNMKCLFNFKILLKIHKALDRWYMRNYFLHSKNLRVFWTSSYQQTKTSLLKVVPQWQTLYFKKGSKNILKLLQIMAQLKFSLITTSKNQCLYLQQMLMDLLVIKSLKRCISFSISLWFILTNQTKINWFWRKR